MDPIIPTYFFIPGHGPDKGWHTATTRSEFDAFKAQGGQAFGSGAKQFEPLRRHGEVR